MRPGEQRKYFCVLLLLALFIGGASRPADMEKGSKIYKDTCQVCHGERGDGQTFVANALNPPPRNFTAEISKKELTRPRMIKSVTNGRPGTAMMPWKDNLSAAEISATVSFIRGKFMGLRD